MQGRAGASHSANGTYSLAVAESAYEPNGNDDDSNASAGGQAGADAGHKDSDAEDDDDCGDRLGNRFVHR